MRIEEGDGVVLFESEGFGGIKFYKQISPTIMANKVCAGVVTYDNRGKNRRDVQTVADNQVTEET